ncbi:MAG: lipopolysaccharide biosynthesis protein [Tannerella sp.]|jgi:O-antigen/teichoic acid export membrane protein|nr:lipopolysaccharide biosynthesis protein [Tannerella sp.]
MGVIIRQSIKGTIVNYIGSFIGFLTTMFVLTRFLQPEEIGLTRVIYEAAVLIAGFAQLGITGTAFRFFPYFQSDKNNHNGFFFYLVLLPTIGIILFIPLYVLLKEPISAFFSINALLFDHYYYWIIFLIIFIAFWTAFEIYSNLLMRIVMPKFIREIAVRILLLAVYLLFAFKFLNLDGLVGGFIAVYGIAMVLTFTYISRISPVSLKHDFSFIDKPLGKKIRNYTLFLVLSSLSGSILNQLDVFMLGSHLGFSYVGVFTIAFFMGNVVEIPSRSISSISSPIAAKALKEGDMHTANQLYKKVSLHQFLAGSIIFLLVWINIDNIFSIIPNGDVFSAGKWVVFFIALAKLLNVTLNFGGILISYSKYYYWTLFFLVFITITGIVSNLILIPKYGITGAAIATFITYMLLSGVQQWIVLAKIKGNPFSMSLLKCFLLIILLFGINYFLPVWSPNPFIDGFYRSLIIGTLTLISLYKLKISDEISLIIDKVLKRDRI